MSYPQPTLPGMEHLAPKQFSSVATTPEPGPFSPEAREERKKANRTVGRTRKEAKIDGGKRLSTASFGLSNDSNIPEWAKYHESKRGARRVVGKVEEVPMVNMPDHEVSTPQSVVLKDRFEEARDNPATRKSPRFFGKGLDELPTVFRHRSGDISVIDGNHRITAGLANGQMIQQSRVLTSRDRHEVSMRSHSIGKAKQRAKEGSDNGVSWMHAAAVAQAASRANPKNDEFASGFHASSPRIQIG